MRILSLLATVVLANLSLSPASAADIAPATKARPPVQAFFGDSEFASVALSPSGRYLAFTRVTEKEHNALVVYDIEQKTLTQLLNFNDTDVDDVQWVNDDRLLFDTRERGVPPGDVDYGPGLYTVGRDGKGYRQLATRRNEPVDTITNSTRRLLPWHTFMIPQTGPRKDNTVYVLNGYASRADRFLRYFGLLKLDVATGISTPVAQPGDPVEWWLDQNGEPRLVQMVAEDKTSVYYLDPATNAWRLLESGERFGNDSKWFSPLAFGADGTLYVEASLGDKRALHVFDLKTNQLNPEPLVSLGDFDFSGEVLNSATKLLGFRIKADAEATAWVAPDMVAVQKDVDALLRGTNNLITAPVRPELPIYLVRVYSDTQPTIYALYDARTKSVQPIGRTHPDIDARQMGQMEFVKYKARDGRSIPAWLTTPAGAGKGPQPMVVLVHGGPFLRGASWGWDADTQFLQSRGYVVLQPEFRGSTGFGFDHFHAGWKQWGQAMQDDLADGVRWAIQKGIADPKRICIAGASYGGYAVLMGLIKDPDLYRCGVNWVGVTDIDLLYSPAWDSVSDMSDAWLRYGMPQLVGDREADAQMLKANSPLQQAARVRQPLLLAYGTNDHRVPIAHGKRFYSAVREVNRNVEWVQYANEGHGWTRPENRYDFWTRVEAFLKQNIGDAQP